MNDIATTLHAAQAASAPIVHDRRNPHQGYDYASAEAVLIEAHRALEAAPGMTVILRGWSRPYVLADCAQNADGPGANTGYATWGVDIKYELRADGAEPVPIEISWPILPGKGRPLDKALATALTASLGYVMRALLLMPRVPAGEDYDQRDDREAAPTGPAANPAPPANTLSRSSHTLAPQPVARDEALARFKMAARDAGATTYGQLRAVASAVGIALDTAPSSDLDRATLVIRDHVDGVCTTPGIALAVSIAAPRDREGSAS